MSLCENKVPFLKIWEMGFEDFFHIAGLNAGDIVIMLAHQEKTMAELLDYFESMYPGFLKEHSEAEAKLLADVISSAREETELDIRFRGAKAFIDTLEFFRQQRMTCLFD